jgi:membrane-associated phospholipid phosphatase
MNPYCDEVLLPSIHTLFRTIFFLFLLNAIIFLSPAGAATENQPADSPATAAAVSPESISADYLRGYLTDTGKIVTSPLRADTRDWLKIGGVFAITGGLIIVDADIRDFAQKKHSSIADSFASAGQKLGSPLYTLPPVGAFYLYGYLRDDSRARTTSLLAVESLAISTIFTETIKVTAQRSRPNSGASPYTWNGPHLKLNNVSFCSGHTSAAFTLATVFAEQYQDSPYIPAVSYSLATLAGLSRIYDNKHWASDAFFGAALGYFIGKSVVGYHKDSTLRKMNVILIPDIRPNYNGLTVQYTF